MVRQNSPQVIRTRIAPSPTGDDLHIGSLQTALFNYAVAKKNKGKFIIRIEDTDRLRFVKGAEEKFLSTLNLFGIQYDEGPDVGGDFGPYRQSDRLDIYKKYADLLIQKGVAYYCFCTKERLIELREKQTRENKKTGYDKHCLLTVKNGKQRAENGEHHVIRLNVIPDKKIWFKDIIRGQITINSNEIDDQVLVKTDGFPTYHLAVVVDDHMMDITHIIRGEEWISSTPKHVLLYEAFEFEIPLFAHTPLIRNPDKSKLSKRKNAVWASWYLEQGFLPEAMLNYLALLGWSHPEEKEIFSLSEFINLFDLTDVKPVGPVFDLVKLKWMNKQYVLMMTDEEFKKVLKAFSKSADSVENGILDKLIPLLKTRIETLSDFDNLTEMFFGKFPQQKFEEEERNIALNLLEEFNRISNWEHAKIFVVIKTIMDKSKTRMPIFYKLLTGKERGLPLPESLEILGKENTLKRLEEVVQQ